ncbi:unnamed protein product [Closterium sp. NIES-53]
MRRKVIVGTSSSRPHVQMNNYGQINSPGDDIRVAMAKNTRKARTSTATSGASCDGDDGDEEHGDDVEEDWPENGHDDSISGDEIAPADIDEDDWWNRPVGSKNKVEEWRAGDSDNDEGVDADGEPAEAAAHATGATVDANAEADNEADAEVRTEEEAKADADAVAPADVATIADSDADALAEADMDAAEGGADDVFFYGENSDDDPWNITGDDDVPLLKRRLRHHLQSKPKRARVVLSDDDSPGEERQPCFTAADKGKSAVAEAPAKATVRRRTSHKKRKNDGDPGSSTGAAKKKKKTPNKDDIVVNEALGNDDDYAEAAGPIPSFPEKAKPKDPTLHNPNSRPPSPRSKDSKKRRHGWTRANGVAISVKDTKKWSHEWMKKHHPGKNWNASSHWSQHFRDRWNLVMRVKTKVGQWLSAECAKDCESFWKFVRINRARHNIDLARIINAVQTPLFVEMPAERTIEHRGARSAPIRTAGYEKTRLTVMLACTASGEKLRPWVWFKLKNVPNCEIPEGIVCQAQDNGWMDESAVQTWLTKEVLPHLNPQRGQNARRAMLLTTPTSVPLAGNLQRPPHLVVLQWIAEAWDQVPKKVIIEVFRHCGISSKLDGTENHLVMSHLRARSTTDVSEDMCLGGTTGDNTRLLGQAPEEEEDEMQAEGVREVAVASGLDVLYKETVRHAWRVQDLDVREPVLSAGEEAVTE